MSRGRFLSKTISLDEKIEALPDDSARLLFTWMIAHLDAEGRMRGDSLAIKALVVPKRAWSLRKIEKYLTNMQQLGLIVIYSRDGMRWLTMPNFEKHQQGLRKDREGQSQIPAPTPAELRQHSGRTPATLRTEVEVEGKVEVEVQELDVKFGVFWSAFPKKKAKKDAEKAFKKLSPDDDLMAVILAAIEKAKTSEQWTGHNGKYIPHPARWLNGRRWEDETTEDTNHGIHQGRSGKRELTAQELADTWRD